MSENIPDIMHTNMSTEFIVILNVSQWVSLFLLVDSSTATERCKLHRVIHSSDHATQRKTGDLVLLCSSHAASQLVDCTVVATTAAAAIWRLCAVCHERTVGL